MGISEIRDKICGTSYTIVFCLASGMEISVDLVPVLYFESELLNVYPEVWKNIDNPKWLQHQPVEYKDQVLPAMKNFFAVPKSVPKGYR